MKKDMYYYYDKAVDCYYRAAAQDVEQGNYENPKDVLSKLDRIVDFYLNKRLVTAYEAIREIKMALMEAEK